MKIRVQGKYIDPTTIKSMTCRKWGSDGWMLGIIYYNKDFESIVYTDKDKLIKDKDFLELNRRIV